MSTANENSQNNLFVFIKPDCQFSNVITYRNNLVKVLNDECNGKLGRFSSCGMTDEKLNDFVSEANKLGYKIYQLRKL